MNQRPIKSVLFDLDGTLLDTAPDLLYAFNQLRHEYSLPPLPIEKIRPVISRGSYEIIKMVLNLDDHDPKLKDYRAQFLTIYEQHLADTTQFFPEIEKVLSFLEDAKIPWGIVTNKLTLHTRALLSALKIEHRPKCIICGDTLKTYKPDPEPILYACELLNQIPKHTLYIGDSITDVHASKAAGTKSLVALYGYIGLDEDPLSWKADGYIKKPAEIIHWL